MATYRNGIETRDALYQSARRNFAAHGYHSTSIKEIVNDVNSKLGLFTYYFESKESLALQVLYELQDAVYACAAACESIAVLEKDALAQDMAQLRVWLHLVNDHAHVQRFVREVSVTDAYLSHASENNRALWQRLNPQAAPNSADALNCTLMTGMLHQFLHDLPLLTLGAPLADCLDHVLRSAYACIIPDARRLHQAVADSRDAAGAVALTIAPDFSVLRV